MKKKYCITYQVKINRWINYRYLYHNKLIIYKLNIIKFIKIYYFLIN